MLDKKTLMYQIRKDVKDIENIINNKNLYNLKCKIMKILIKNGIMIDYAIPFIVGGTILFNVMHLGNITPFITDKVNVKAKVETINTSTGIYKEKFSLDNDYDNSIKFQHSTGWKINSDNLYERILTTYKINDFLKFKNNEELLSLTKEEIEDMFIITNVVKIKKNVLEPDDYLYVDDMLFITTAFKNNQKTKIKNESLDANMISTILYLIGTYLIGLGIINLQKKSINKCLRTKLKNLESKYKPKTKKEIEFLNKIIEVKRENLVLLDESSKNIGENKQLYKIYNK